MVVRVMVRVASRAIAYARSVLTPALTASTAARAPLDRSTIRRRRSTFTSTRLPSTGFFSASVRTRRATFSRRCCRYDDRDCPTAQMGSRANVRISSPRFNAPLMGTTTWHAHAPTVRQHYRDYCSNSMVLKFIIDAFEPGYYSQNAIALVALIKQAEPSKTSTVQVIARHISLGPLCWGRNSINPSITQHAASPSPTDCETTTNATMRIVRRHP